MTVRIFTGHVLDRQNPQRYAIICGTASVLITPTPPLTTVRPYHGGR